MTREIALTVDMPAPRNGAVSLTQFLQYMDCPKKWYYQYVLRMPTPVAPALTQGSICHAVLENAQDAKLFPARKAPAFDDFLAQRKIQEQIYEKLLVILQKQMQDKDILAELGQFTSQERDEISVNCRFVLHVASQRMLWRVMNKASREAKKDYPMSKAWEWVMPRDVELKYVVRNEAGERIVTGLVDAIVESLDKTMSPVLLSEERDRVIIVDYKTSKRFETLYKPEYEYQVLLYSWMYWKDKGRLPDKAVVDYIFYGQEVAIEISMEGVLWIEQALRRFIDELNVSSEEMAFVCNKQQMFGPKFNCDYCPFDEICPKFPAMPKAMGSA